MITKSRIYTGVSVTAVCLAILAIVVAITAVVFTTTYATSGWHIAAGSLVVIFATWQAVKNIVVVVVVVIAWKKAQRLRHPIK